MGTHIVLFLKQKTENEKIDFKILTDKLSENYKEIGNAILLENSTKPNEPKFIFKENKELLIDGNNHHISINLFNDYSKMKEEVIEMLWDAFDYCDIEFARVGYITEVHKNVKDLEYTKKQIFNSKINKDIDEFQIGFHNIIKFQRKNINCWHRFVKFYDTPLIISYDINTREQNFGDINYKILKEFMNFADEYINNDINNYIKEEK